MAVWFLFTSPRVGDVGVVGGVVVVGAPAGGARTTGVFELKAHGRAILSVLKLPVARSCLSRSKSGQSTRWRLSKSCRSLPLNSVWRIRRRATGKAGFCCV